MIDEEKAIARTAKADATECLRRLDARMDADYAHVLDTDARIGEYAHEVATHPERHNLFEQLSVLRFFKLVDKYKWKGARLKRFVKFYESLRFSGVRGRRHYRLTPVQTFQFANIYGLAEHDGRRLVRTAYLFVPRKFSKTTSAAAMAVYDMLFGDNNAQAYVGANSYDQAKICFDEIRNIMNDIDPGGKHFRVNRERIYFKDHGRDSLIRCLTANAKTQDGLFASLVILDEYAQARNTGTKNGADLKNVLTTSMGPRREPLTVVITTASEVLDGPCYNEIEGAKKVLLGEIEADSMFASLFMPDADDAEDSPDTWIKVQPHLGVTVQADYYEREWATAQLSPENLLAFRTKLLNVFAVSTRSSWLDSDTVRRAMRPISTESQTGKPRAVVAIDLSESDDFSAVSWATKGEGGALIFHTAYFFPEGALKGHHNERLYRKWAADGHLYLCHGPVIDYDMIADYVLGLAEPLRVVRVGYDAYKSQVVVNKIGNARIGAWNSLGPVGQTKASFTAPVEAFEHGIKTGRIFINDNPINAYCFGNAVLIYDDNGNCKPWHRAETQKIDGVITMLMCMRQIIDYQW